MTLIQFSYFGMYVLGFALGVIVGWSVRATVEIYSLAPRKRGPHE
jgi:hypothetical protein